MRLPRIQRAPRAHTAAEWDVGGEEERAGVSFCCSGLEDSRDRSLVRLAPPIRSLMWRKRKRSELIAGTDENAKRVHEAEAERWRVGG